MKKLIEVLLCTLMTLTCLCINKNVSIFANGSFTITKTSTTNGSFEVSANSAAPGTVVTITPTAYPSYEVDTVKYNDGTDHDVTNNNGYSFTMPAANVTVTVTFKAIDHTHSDPSIVFNKVLNDCTNVVIPSGNYYLSGDMDLSNFSSANNAIQNADGATVNICLNGHILKQSSGNNSVIFVKNGTINVYDCGQTEHKFEPDVNGKWVQNDAGSKSVTGGVITGGNTNNNGGGGVFVAENGIFNMYGGNIVGNTASGTCAGGAIFNRNVVTLNNTNVIGNTAYDGGAVYNESTFNSNNSTFEYNKATNQGGAFRIYGGSVKLNGDSIKYNSSKWGGGINYRLGSLYLDNVTVSNNTVSSDGTGAGVGNFTDGTIYVGGTTKIFNNIKGDNISNNLYLQTNATITLGDGSNGVGALTSGANIGIKMGTNGVFASSGATDVIKGYFNSDDVNYYVLRENDTLKIGIPNYSTITFNLEGGDWVSGFTAPTTYANDVGCDLPTSSNISRTGYTFAGWTATNDVSDTTYITNISTTETENKIFYAKWIEITYDPVPTDPPVKYIAPNTGVRNINK